MAMTVVQQRRMVASYKKQKLYSGLTIKKVKKVKKKDEKKKGKADQ